MIAIGRYMLLFIALSGLTLSVDGKFSEDDIDKFLDYIFRLHNAVRLKHKVPKLERTYAMDVRASYKLNAWLNNTDNDDEQLGVILNWMDYDNATQLNVAEAIKFFSLSYELGNFYNYESNPITNYANEYTQIVWQATTQIGIAFRCESNTYVVLAVYYPRGNKKYRYRFNVQRPKNSIPAIDSDIPGLIYQTEKEKFLDYILKLHNKARTSHGVLPLDREDYLDDVARSMLRSGMKTPTEKHGVNWHTFGNVNIPLDDEDAEEVFSIWYKRKTNYNYHEEPSTNYTNAFSQVVWRKTLKIGIDVQKGFGGEYHIIVVYEPRGNIPGEFRSNVLMPRIMEQGDSSDNNL